VIEVRDDGIGLPAEIDLLDPKTIGMELMRILTEQINGTLEFHINGGTSAVLRFPLPHHEPAEGASPGEGKS
jgi:two-component sensor histidine kinase